MSDTSTRLLSVESLTKHFGATRALHDVSVDLHSGEVLCIVGENGAGKSTLIKILSGAISPDSGTITVQDGSYHSLTPNQAIDLGLATIYQEVELIESLSVAANIFLGNEPKSIMGFVDSREQNRRAREILDMLHIDIDERTLVENLSAAQQQTLQIVKALHQDSRILIMDEPTSSLGMEETRALMRLIHRLRKRGIGIMYISHHLDEVFEVGDTVLILKDGEHVGTYPRSELDSASIVRKMVGRDTSAFFNRPPLPIGEPWFRAEAISWNGIVREVSFTVRKGEVFGIGGLVGSGRTELVSTIFGIVQPDNGHMWLGEKPVRFRTPADAIAAGVCLITEDRHNEGLFAERSVAENITVVHNEVARQRIVGLQSENVLTSEMIRKLRIVVGDKGQRVLDLSGGNQQKVIISRWLLDEFELYIFDEPTKGVDVGAKQEIYNLIIDMARKGKCVIMISSDMPELLSMSDRIGVMRQGRMTQILENKDIKEQELIGYFMGEEANSAT